VGATQTSTDSLLTAEVPTVEVLPDQETAPVAVDPGLPRTPTVGPSTLTLPGWTRAPQERRVNRAPTVLSMVIDSGDPVSLRAVDLRGVDTTATGSLRPVRVLDPGSRSWNLVGQVSDFSSGSATIVADNLGWRPTVHTEWGASHAIEAGPAAAPGDGTGLGDARVLCSGRPGSQPAIASCSGELRLGIPGTTRSGEYTALLTLTLI
jgi:hypothetical protein